MDPSSFWGATCLRARAQNNLYFLRGETNGACKYFLPKLNQEHFETQQIATKTLKYSKKTKRESKLKAIKKSQI